MATAIQILCVLSRFASEGTTAVMIGRSLDTNPVVVRRMLKDLAVAGLVHVQPGRNGGARLARPTDEITLYDVSRAVEVDAGVFAMRPGGNPRCPVNRAMPDLLSPVFSAVDAAVAQTLSKTTLASLTQHIPERTAS